MSQSSIWVRHNAEIAHRLSQLPGKCQNIHGHSLQIELQMFGKLNGHGILEGFDFGSVKKQFREYIDGTYDHHLLMNISDPLLGGGKVDMISAIAPYPGLKVMPADPTIENISLWIAQWCMQRFQLSCNVRVQETNTNGAACSIRPAK